MLLRNHRIIASPNTARETWIFDKRKDTIEKQTSLGWCMKFIPLKI